MKSVSTYMLTLALGGLATGTAMLSAPATGFAAEPESCSTVRFSDVGWTDITSTTAVATEILKGLGYKTDIKVLSVPVTYASLSKKDIDVFLGYWNPSMTADLQPYLDNKTVETLRTNLTGAKYTLAVPKYAYDEGLKDFKDIATFRISSAARSTASSRAMTAIA